MVSDYIRGLEDALEYALHVVTNAKDLEEARKHLEDVLHSIKEKKLESVRRILIVLRT